MATGKCGCGAVTYEVDVIPMVVHCCHCSWCQRETGSAFVLNAIVETDAVRLEGKTEALKRPTESGGHQQIVSCPECRSVLYSHYGGMGKPLAFLRVGTLDDPSAFPPTVHIFTSTKQPWVILGDDVPIYEGYYKMRDVWSDAAVERFKKTR